MREELTEELTEKSTMQEPDVLCTRPVLGARQDALREYSINIEFLSIGCIIRVGCKSVPFSTVKEGMEALNAYVANPYETRKIWEERFEKEL
jgi:hypothetical protein